MAAVSHEVSGPERAVSVWSPSLVWLLAGTLAVFPSFFLLLSVVPQYATEGGAGPFGAGAGTGVFMLATVVLQLFMPRMLARFGYRRMLAAGAVLLGAPTALLVLSAELGVILLVSAVRGLGFGIVTVAFSALVAELVPPSRRGQGAGLYGGAVGIAGVAGLPLGVLLADQAGYASVFLLAAVLPLLSLAALPAMRAPAPAVDTRRRGVLRGLLDGDLRRPFQLLLAFSLASGAVVTFVPLAAADVAGLASLALLVQQVCAAGSRWVAGLAGDRFGNGRLLLPAVLAGVAGLAVTAWTGGPLLLIGMVLFGLGFGVAQNATLVVMFHRVDRQEFGSVSTQWNIAFDAGTGLGAAMIGIVVQYAGFAAGFAVAAALLLATVGGAIHDRAAR
ncbi:arabinose efflux permease family protein [Actinoalloteichus sp. GBA129-24]|uniref:Arabinose efflux permease family protein n=1 Tax=Actinoalloteichus fjordicus TaxID=1612552 RepID=A0AAC9LG68_9PSEU|nr:arabinose efflux permease family protein [Actinoalloteichus fjordicus]APU23331.1 arabinose efflux permease family protein [Actinoalloteichus sp. GBA129-24]